MKKIPTPPQTPPQYQRDQSPPKAIPNNTQTRLLKQESVDLNQTSQDIYHDTYLEPQESVESYIEEEPEKPRDSPDEQSLRRGSSQITVVDPYHPGHDYASRRPSLARRTSVDEDTYPRKPSLAVATPPAEDVIQELQVGDIKFNRIFFKSKLLQQQEIQDEDIPEKKSVSFEEEDEAKPRPQVTAQQRWLWAYNKIIMQLNVSVYLIETCCFNVGNVLEFKSWTPGEFKAMTKKKCNLPLNSVRSISIRTVLLLIK